MVAKIRNPNTGRLVKRSGKLGKQILARKKRRTPTKSRRKYKRRTPTKRSRTHKKVRFIPTGELVSAKSRLGKKITARPHQSYGGTQEEIMASRKRMELSKGYKIVCEGNKCRRVLQRPPNPSYH